jgi:hypothetical protein
MKSIAADFARVSAAFEPLNAWRGAVLEMGVENAEAKDDEMHLEYPARRMEAVNAWNEAYEAHDELFDFLSRDHEATQEARMTRGRAAEAASVAAGTGQIRQRASAAAAAAERALAALRAARRAKAAAAAAGGGAGSGSVTRAGAAAAAALAGGAPPEDEEEENADEEEENADDENEEDLGENKTEPFLTLGKIEESLGTSFARVLKAFDLLSRWALWETSAAGQEVLVGALEEQEEAFARRREFRAAYVKAKVYAKEAFSTAFAGDDEGAASARIAQARAASEEVARLAGAAEAAAGRVVAAARAARSARAAAPAAGPGAAPPGGAAMAALAAAAATRPFAFGTAGPPAPGVSVFGPDRSAPPPGREEKGAVAVAGAGAFMGMWDELGPICESHDKDTARSAEAKGDLDFRARVFHGLLRSGCIASNEGAVTAVFKTLHVATEAHAELEDATAKARAAIEASLESLEGDDEAAASASLREAKAASEERTRLADAYADAAGRAKAAIGALQLASPSVEDLDLASQLEDLDLASQLEDLHLASQLEDLDLASQLVDLDLASQPRGGGNGGDGNGGGGNGGSEDGGGGNGGGESD